MASYLSNYIRTVSYLKPRQMAYQLIRRLGPGAKATPIAGGVVPRQGVAPVQPLCRQMKRDENTFTFLNKTRSFDPACFDWSPQTVGKLWRYNLHYFDYLNEKKRSWESKARLVEKLDSEHSPGYAGCMGTFSGFPAYRQLDQALSVA